jgi:hypothetical protein
MNMEVEVTKQKPKNKEVRAIIAELNQLYTNTLALFKGNPDTTAAAIWIDNARKRLRIYLGEKVTEEMLDHEEGSETKTEGTVGEDRPVSPEDSEASEGEGLHTDSLSDEGMGSGSV